MILALAYHRPQITVIDVYFWKENVIIIFYFFLGGGEAVTSKALEGRTTAFKIHSAITATSAIPPSAEIDHIFKRQTQRALRRRRCSV